MRRRMSIYRDWQPTDENVQAVADDDSAFPVMRVLAREVLTLRSASDPLKDLVAVKIGYWQTYLEHYAVANERNAVEKMIADLREIYTPVTKGSLDGPGCSDTITWGGAVHQLKCWNCAVVAAPEMDGGTAWCKSCGVVHDAPGGVSQSVA
jgi:hypothetical protein